MTAEKRIENGATMSLLGWRPLSGTCRSGIPSGHVVAVGFVFDARPWLKNEATLRAYSTPALPRSGVSRGL